MAEPVKFAQSAAEQQFYLAHVWQAKGKTEVAIAALEKALALQPNYTEAYLKLALVLIEQERQEEAIAVYQRAMVLNPNEATFYKELLDHLLNKPSTPNNPDFLPLTDESKGHILLYTDCPEIYGAAQLNHALMCGLVRFGYKVTCVQSQASHYLIHQRYQLGIQHFWLKPDNVYHQTKQPRAFTNTDEAQEILQLAQPDMIIFGDGCPVSSLAAQQVASQMAIPFIKLIHCVTADWAEKFRSYLPHLPDIYQSARAVITVSQENLDLLRQRFQLPPNLGQVIYNGRPPQYFNPPNLQVRDRLRQELSIPVDAVVCFTAARLDSVKGYQYQLSAIQHLQQRQIWPKLYFIWAGTGNLSLRLKTVAAELGVSNHIKFVGERSDIPDLLDATDIFILPSQFEGMPLAIMEAMAKGKPVIASAVSGIPEELGDTGKLLIDPKLDPQATIRELVATLETWVMDAQLRSTIGQACQKRAEKIFREERMIGNYISIIESIYSHPPS